VYLIDVQRIGTGNYSAFKESAWFTTGWTLKELMAPENMEFYEKSWLILGTKKSLTDASRK
jgi:hypothetical protein